MGVFINTTTFNLTIDNRGSSETRGSPAPMAFPFASDPEILAGDTLANVQPNISQSYSYGSGPPLTVASLTLSGSTWNATVSITNGTPGAQISVTCIAQTTAGNYIVATVNVTLTGPGFHPPLSPIPGPETQNVGTFFAGPVSGNPATPLFRAIEASDLPTNRLIALTDASTINIDLSTGSNFYLLFTSAVGASRTLTVTNATKGQQWSLQTQQPASGGPCTATFFSGITWTGGTQPSFSTQANFIDTWEFNTTASSPSPTFIGSLGGGGSGSTGNYRHVTTTTNVSASDFTISGDATSASFAVNLLAAATAPAHRAITVLKTDVTINVITITPAGSDVINGQTSYVLAGQYSSVTIEPDGVSNWYAVATE